MDQEVDTPAPPVAFPRTVALVPSPVWRCSATPAMDDVDGSVWQSGIAAIPRRRQPALALQTVGSKVLALVQPVSVDGQRDPSATPRSTVDRSASGDRLADRLGPSGCVAHVHHCPPVTTGRAPPDPRLTGAVRSCLSVCCSSELRKRTLDRNNTVSVRSTPCSLRMFRLTERSDDVPE
jgi:hypothetical protein